MISPWDIYWVMQLDSIGAASVLLSIFAVPSAIFTALAAKEGELPWSVPVILAPFAALLLFAAIFLPSSKTAAAMLVIPAIANNETIQREAGDLYQLAKDGLRELVKPDESVKAEKVEK